MRDTEPLTTSRVQVKMLALPVYPAVLTTLHWSPEVKCVQQSGANTDESDVAPSTHFFASHTGQGGTEVTFQTGRWRGRRAQCGWQTQSRLPKLLDTRCRQGHLFRVLAHSDWCTGFVLVEQRVTKQAGK